MKIENEIRIGAALLIIVTVGPHFLSSAGTLLTAKVAATGGLWALIGVIGIARPVWRIGPFNWLTQNVYSVVDSSFRDKRLDDPEEKANDEVMQNVFGPILVGAGTVLNGFSGYF